jgi:hypothetical protein
MYIPEALPDNIDQQAGPHSPNAPGTAPRTPTIQPRIVNVPAGTVGEDTMSVQSAGQMIGDWRVVLAEDWYIYMVDQQGKMWFYDTEVWPEWEKVPNAWGQDTLSEQPTVEAMIPYAEMHEPKPVMSDDRRTQMTLEQFMNNVKDEERGF